MTDAADLIERAQRTRIVVIGGGLAGLVAARECAELGLRVTLLEAGSGLGGGIARAELDGLTLDVGADSFAPVLLPLVEELGLGDAVEHALPGGRWIAGPQTAAPLPAESILGIPANPWAPEVRRLIGWGGAWRAYLDRLRPPLTIGHEHRLGVLVRTRMGARVAERLVAPMSLGVFGVDPDRVDVDVAAPGLNQALTRVGSLSGAVAQEAPEAPTPRLTLHGGMSALVEALRRRLDDLAVDVRTDTPAASVARAADPTADAGPTAHLSRGWRVTAGEETLDADAVIVATGESAARALLAPVVPALRGEPVSPAPVDAVTLVVSSRALDAAPRSHAVYPVPGTATALAVSHATATWPWLAAAAGPGRHVVRVDLPRDPSAGIADPVATARLEAATLLGASIEGVRAAHVEPRERTLPASAIDHPGLVLRGAVAALPGLGLTGAWVDGSGLAAVAAGAAAEGRRVRHAALWAHGR